MSTANDPKPTPGPWTVEENVDAGGILHLAVTNRAAGRDWMPCSVSQMRTVRDVDRANARLIASAPDLAARVAVLEAANAELVKTLEHIRDKFRHDPKCQSGDNARPPVPCNCALGAARAALAKALSLIHI